METQSIRSLTIRQLRDTPQPDVPTETLTLVGRLTFVPGSTTSWLFDLDDSTGVLRVSRNRVITRVVDSVEERIKQESNELSNVQYDIGKPSWEDGEYHRVWGMMTAGVFEAVEIRPLQDMNELTMHMLECIYQHCRMNKKDKKYIYYT
jgi:hypothetical protein